MSASKKTLLLEAASRAGSARPLSTGEPVEEVPVHFNSIARDPSSSLGFVAGTDRLVRRIAGEVLGQVLWASQRDGEPAHGGTRSERQIRPAVIAGWPVAAAARTRMRLRAPLMSPYASRAVTSHVAIARRIASISAAAASGFASAAAGVDAHLWIARSSKAITLAFPMLYPTRLNGTAWRHRRRPRTDRD